MEKNILPNLTNSQEPEPVIFAPWSWSRSGSNKNTRSRSRLGKNQEPEAKPLEKKSGAGAAKKLAGSPALIILQSFFHLVIPCLPCYLSHFILRIRFYCNSANIASRWPQRLPKVLTFEKHNRSARLGEMLANGAFICKNYRFDGFISAEFHQNLKFWLPWVADILTSMAEI